jgi:two-component system response regulator AtoC
MAPSIIGISQHIENIKKLIHQIVKTEKNVLIIGESGVGKDLIAQNLYLRSKRVGKPFVKINCALVAGTGVENEIFGPETTIQSEFQEKKRGVLESVRGGVLFLDKIDAIPLALQTKFFQLLKRVDCTPPLDSEKALKTNVWIMAATSRDLEDDVIAGKFNQDLFCYLSTKKILIEPLRKRPEDIPYLIQHYMQHFADGLNVEKIKGPKKRSIRRMLEYHWPGNVRELQSTLKQIMIFGDNEAVYRYRIPLLDNDLTPPTDALVISDMSHCLSMV